MASAISFDRAVPVFPPTTLLLNEAINALTHDEKSARCSPTICWAPDAGWRIRLRHHGFGGVSRNSGRLSDAGARLSACEF